MNNEENNKKDNTESSNCSIGDNNDKAKEAYLKERQDRKNEHGNKHI